MGKKIAIVVCGIKNHIVLLEKLKKRGYHTILVDAAESPIAKEAADEFEQIDIFDFEGIKQLAVDRGVVLIINACQEHLNAGICKISEELGLPHPYSYETGMAISNKELMKQRMKENGIPTTDYMIVSSMDDIDDMQLTFPVYVKSCVGSGSNAVNRACNKKEVALAIEKALRKYPNEKVIVEEEAYGKEYNVYCFPEGGKANVLLIARRYTDNLSGDHVTKLIGTLTPALISEEAVSRINETAQRITEAFNLDNVPMFMQIMVEDDKVNVIEFAGRMAGGFGYQTIYEKTGVDWFEATINGFLRAPNNIKVQDSKEYITVSHVYGYPCVYGKLIGWEDLVKDGTICSISLPKTSGMKVQDGFANSSLIAYLVHKDESLEGLLDKIQFTFKKIDMIDDQGNSKLNRELRLTKDRILDLIDM